MLIDRFILNSLGFVENDLTGHATVIMQQSVSFETRNLCTFLLCLFRSIISSLVNDYYLISFFLFQSVSDFFLSTCTRYHISYFIAISCCRHYQFCLLFTYDPLSAIYLQSLGARPK